MGRVDEHFLQPEEIPRRLGRVRRRRLAGRLLERGFEDDRPDDQHHRAENQRDEFRVHQVRPHPHAIGFLLLDRPLTFRDALVVQHPLANRIPGEEHDQEDQPDDWYVVGFEDDELEVRVEVPEDEEQREETEETVADGLLREHFALPDHEDQGGQRHREEQSRVGQAVEESFD
jgi:heat shock protein HspQ